jgi:membrane-bound hydrogenase subunit beta
MNKKLEIIPEDSTENDRNSFLAPLEKPKVFPEGIIEYFKKRFGDKIIEDRVEKRKISVKKNEQNIVWFRVERSVFKDAVKHLLDLQFPHLSVVSGNDVGENIELIYHFTVNYGEHLKEIPVNISVEVSKNDLRIPTICDIIPGALVTEREKQEMLGVKVENMPDSGRMFLPDDFPENVYPWRKDEKGIPENMIKKLWEEKK